MYDVHGNIHIIINYYIMIVNMIVNTRLTFILLLVNKIN